MSLKLKLFLPLLVFSILLAVYVFTFWIPRTIGYVERSYHENLIKHLESIAETIAPHITRGQTLQVGEILESLVQKNKGWISIQLKDNQGAVVYTTTTQALRKSVVSPEIRELEQEINPHGSLGKMVLKVDFRPQLSIIRAQQRELIFTAMMVMVIFSLLIGFTIEALIRRPLTLLASASDKLAKGEFETPLPSPRGDEVGTLVHSFAAMRQAIRSSQEKLVAEIAERRTAEEQLRLTASRLVALLGNLQAGTLMVDEDGRVIIVNQRFFSMFSINMRASDVIGAAGRDLIDEAKQMFAAPEQFASRAEEIIQGRQLVSGEELLLDDGRIFERDYVPVFLEERYVGHLWQYRDITDRKRAAIALFQEKERAQVTLQSIGDGVVTVDAQGNIEYLNPAAEAITGWNTVQARGRPSPTIINLFFEETGKDVADPVAQCLQGETLFTASANIVLRRRDGSEIAIEHSAAPIRDRDGNVVGVVVILHDDSQARSMANQLSWQACHDPLTELFNRRKFEQSLEGLLLSARLNNMQHALLYLDLDQFKIVNDTCAHLAGDELLRQMSALLQSLVRDSDVLARLGGDEFGVLLQQCPPDRALTIANVIREAVGDYRFAWQGKPFNIGVSIGLVNIDAQSESVTALLSAADTACYAAKDKGRNRVQVYQPGDSELQQRHGEMQWVSRIHDAFENSRFLLYTQSIIALGKGAPVTAHCEILLRMRDERGELLPPMAFIPAAERYSLMPSIDRWVIRSLFAKLRGSPRLAEGLHTYAVNLSGTSLNDEMFLEFVLDQFRDGKVAPEWICFEITETSAIANLSKAIHFMGTLKKLGCRFSLDDFGSGLSSFVYLKTLPVDYLKIDGSFIKDIVTDPVSKAMVKAINEVGHIMGIQTIAEYVESPDILQQVMEIGMDFAQGVGISKPKPF